MPYSYSQCQVDKMYLLGNLMQDNGTKKQDATHILRYKAETPLLEIRFGPEPSDRNFLQRYTPLHQVSLLRLVIFTSRHQDPALIECSRLSLSSADCFSRKLPYLPPTPAHHG